MTISNSIAKGLGINGCEGISVESEVGKGSVFSFIIENRVVEQLVKKSESKNFTL